MPHNDILVSPSILSADQLCLREDLASVEPAADLLHVDVMDGVFVPNLTFGPGLVSALKGAFETPLDVHLMICDPDRRALTYAQAGADFVTFHWEASAHPHRLATQLAEAGVLVGVALNPATPVSVLECIVNVVDMVLVMTVEPGFGGQKFIDYTYAKVQAVRAMADAAGRNLRIEVDGGVSRSNAGRLAAAGADVLVAGSAVFNAPDRAEEIRSIRAAAQAARAE